MKTSCNTSELGTSAHAKVCNIVKGDFGIMFRLD